MITCVKERILFMIEILCLFVIFKKNDTLPSFYYHGYKVSSGIFQFFLKNLDNKNLIYLKIITVFYFTIKYFLTYKNIFLDGFYNILNLAFIHLINLNFTFLLYDQIILYIYLLIQP